jgi:hypothetical protein
VETLHYLPGFVPGTRNVFAPVAIATAPVDETAFRGRVEIGAILEPDGRLERKLYADRIPMLLMESLARAFNDAGLSPVVLSGVPGDRKPPSPSRFLVVAGLREFRVEKRFGAEITVHGRYFAMHSRAGIEIGMFDAAGRKLFSSEVTGTEDEPPVPAGAEAFLPLESDPAESLSVALSRAIGAIVLEPKLRRFLPPRR